MKCQLKFILGAGFTLFSFTSFLFSSVSVSADERLTNDNMIELSNEEYEKYINDLLRPTFFQEFINEMSASAVDLNKDTYTSTNVPKSSGIGSAGGSSVLKDFGKEILRDITTKIINDSMIDNSGCQMPEFRQQTGKLRNVYNSGLVEIITCTMTTYQTPVVGVLGGNTVNYDNHCILTLIRQIDDHYTITTICDESSKKYCDVYTATGNYTVDYYSPDSHVYYGRFFDGATQETIPNHQILGNGTSIKFNFYDLPFTIDEIPNTNGLGTAIYFLVYDRQGLPEFSSGSQYRPLNYILQQHFIYSSDSISARGALGCAFAVSNTIMNNYQDYIQQEEYNETAKQKQSITYLSELNTTNVINQNNINDYSHIFNNFDSWYQSNVTDVVNNNITNIYNNYWTMPTDPPTPTQPPTNPPETIPPITQPVTDPPETIPPATQPPTDPPETIPPVTQPPTDPPEAIPPDTFLPPIPSETLLPEYTLDVSAISAGIVDIKKQAFTIDFSGSFWFLEVMNYLLTETGLLPLFIFAFFMSLLGYFLWK